MRLKRHNRPSTCCLPSYLVLGGNGLIGMKGLLIRLKVGEGDVLFYIDRKVKRKEISGLLLFIDPNDKKNS